MTLYHASPFRIEHPDVCHSRDHLDFGKGFYLTVLYEQARQYARRFLLRGGTAYINSYHLDDDLSAYKVKIFTHYDEEWLDYVGACRRGIGIPPYDVVEGGIANDRVFNTIDLYFSGLIAKTEALGRLAYEHPNHQLCILNQTVIDRHLHYLGVEELHQPQKGGTDASR